MSECDCEVGECRAPSGCRLAEENAQLRRVLEIIAGEATDGLKRLQAKAALANIGPR